MGNLRVEGQPEVLQEETKKILFPPVIVVLAGLPRTGKGTLANALAQQTNFVHLDVDYMRYKEHPPEMIPPRGTDEEEYQKMIEAYRNNHKLAKQVLIGGKPVILNATYSRSTYHEMLHELSRETGCQIIFYQLEAPDDVIRERFLSGQQSGASNISSFAQYEAIRSRYETYSGPLVRINTALPIGISVGTILEHLQNRVSALS